VAVAGEDPRIERLERSVRQLKGGLAAAVVVFGFALLWMF
jgi:hypothetical protein